MTDLCKNSGGSNPSNLGSFVSQNVRFLELQFSDGDPSSRTESKSRLKSNLFCVSRVLRTVKCVVDLCLLFVCPNADRRPIRKSGKKKRSIVRHLFSIFENVLRFVVCVIAF